MADIGTSVTLASVIVGMLAIPAASQSLGEGQDLISSPPNISANSETPRQVSVNRTTDGITKSIQTAIQSFKAKVGSEGASAKLQGPSTSLEVNREPGKTVWKLKSSEGTLELVKSSTKTQKTVETSEGTLKITKADGKTSRSFEGTSRKQLKKSMETLETKMEQKLEEARGKINATTTHQENGQTIVQTGLEISVSPETPEYITIKNSGEFRNLEGWKLQNNNPDTHEFGNLELNASESIRVYTAEDEDINYTGRAVYDTGLSWEDGGDTVTLRKPDETKAAEKTY
ncbi:MAG: lamin tail domain-containing protein [Nanohaloarchaea archaeon]|nr:lamin tail domain-containing protein [Candidatus Nanohaloarchaea archaeon]